MSGIDDADPEALERITRAIRDFVPHNRALDLRVERFEGSGDVWVRLPFDAKLVGNPARGLLHGGAISTMMDAAGGLSVMARLGRPSAIATLDLRIDYLRRADAGKDVVAHASCYRVTKHVCFVRGVAYHDDESDPIAALTATFARKSA